MISRRQIIDSNQQADSGEFGPYKLSSQQQLNKQARTREDAKLAKPQSDHRTSLSSSNNSRTKMPAARGQNKTNRQKNFLLGRQDFEGQQERLEEEEEEPEEEFALAGDQMADYRHFDPYSVYGEEDEEEDVWYSEERLFEDHIQEIIDKWYAIDDEIWAKIICMERNRRIAKAYARKHSLLINGTEDDYLDGTTLGLNSFENPDRDFKTRHIKQYIGQGIRIKITQNGDILVKRLSKANIYVHQFNGKLVKQLSLSDGTNSNSSSDGLYALNSDFNLNGNDFYGVIGGNGPLSSSANFSSSTSFSNYRQSGKTSIQQGKQSMLLADGAAKKQKSKLSMSNNSDASTSSSSGNGKSISTRNSNATAPAKSVTSGQQVNKMAQSSIALDFNKPLKIFDMNKFKQFLDHESKQQCPNRKWLQEQCISIVSFVLDDKKILNLPSWIMIINIVAIDLLKSELGLTIDPYDFLASEAPQLRSKLPRQREEIAKITSSFGSNYNFNYSLSNSRSSHYGSQQQLAASKKAFANAAALGAYNGRGYQAGSGQKFSHMYGANDDDDFGDEQDDEGDPILDDNELENEQLLIKRNELIKNSGGKLLKQVIGAPAKKPLSSGFNSQSSSSQDGSSAASSNSNIAGESVGAFNLMAHHTNNHHLKASASEQNLPAKESRRQMAAATKQQKKESSSVMTGAEKNRSCQNLSAIDASNCLEASMAAPRGARPPKLPHRVSETNRIPASPIQVSKAIPIPAPPTSPNGCPSGKANLILVSPTGLSPPMPKRKLQESDKQPIPEFDTIKHIDEKGQCKILRKNINNKPPSGVIPAHAQLAPPATQKHILRYLMSASRLYQPPLPQQQPQLPLRIQRPLPILPTDRAATDRQEEENLYYCGLQARATSTNPASRSMVNQPNSNQHNIEAILAEYRLRTSAFQQRVANYSGHQQPSSRKPLLRKLFNGKSQSKENDQPISKTNKLFLSVDNLHQQQQSIVGSSSTKLHKSPTILSNLKLLKRSKKSNSQEQANNQ